MAELEKVKGAVVACDKCGPSYVTMLPEEEYHKQRGENEKSRKRLEKAQERFFVTQQTKLASGDIQCPFCGKEPTDVAIREFLIKDILR
jgi:DNA-directed RNA polymerase subunit M/transcription elongation factor TFIIS